MPSLLKPTRTKGTLEEESIASLRIVSAGDDFKGVVKSEASLSTGEIKYRCGSKEPAPLLVDDKSPYDALFSTFLREDAKGAELKSKTREINN
jgi:hypothetical protein